MLRWGVLALLLANVLFWAWSRGWLGVAPGPQREPWRLEQQVRPDSVRLLPPDSVPQAAASAPQAAASSASAASGPASAASGAVAAGSPAASAASAAGAGAAALACFESAPLEPAALQATEQALLAVLPARGWIRAARETPPQHAVVLGPLTGADAMQKKREELTRLRVGFEEVRLPGNAGAGLALGRYETPSAAQAALDGFAQRGVRTARVLLLRPAGTETRLRIDNATPAQADALRAFKAPSLGSAGLSACGSAPAASSGASAAAR